MKVQYMRGDIFDTDISIICHLVNAQGVMAAGIAKDIRSKYPQVYKDYMDLWRETTDPTNFHQKKQLDLGEIIVTRMEEQVIISLVGQKYYGREKGRRYVSYDAIADGFEKIEKEFPNSTIAMPQIGSGLAGGDWDIIEGIIEGSCKTVTPVVYIL